MDFTSILIGLGVIIALIIIGKIFAVLTKIFVVILLVAALAVGFFFWQNNNNSQETRSSVTTISSFV